jgi:hypothetical protein
MVGYFISPCLRANPKLVYIFFNGVCPMALRKFDCVPSTLLDWPYRCNIMPMFIYGAWRDTISDGEQFQEPLVRRTTGGWAGGARHLVALGLQLDDEDGFILSLEENTIA